MCALAFHYTVLWEGMGVEVEAALSWSNAVWMKETESEQNTERHTHTQAGSVIRGG